VSSVHSWSVLNRGVGGEDGRGSVAAEPAVHHSSRMHNPNENRDINKMYSVETCSFLSGHSLSQEASSPQPLVGNS